MMVYLTKQQIASAELSLEQVQEWFGVHIQKI